MRNLKIMNISDPSFILIGIPGLEEFHMWIAIPWSCMYIVAFLSNFAVLMIIKMERSLHEPMYMFLSMLLSTDLVSSNASVPKMLLLFWLNMREISFQGCLFQMFLVHSSAFMGSGVLVAMAFDRYTAICHALRYTAILTNRVIMTIGLVVVLRGVLVVLPYPCLVWRLVFCRSRLIIQTYCEHMPVAKLSCTDNSVNVVYGVSAALSLVGVDTLFIALSYFRIIRTVFKMPSKEARSKAFNTCAAHICVILILYIPAIFSIATQRFSVTVPLHVQILLSNIYLVLPTMLNPIVYGIKTKPIRVKILAFLQPMTIRQNHNH